MSKEMPNITLSMDKKSQEKLRELAKKEHRSLSQQVVYMMECYAEGKE